MGLCDIFCNNKKNTVKDRYDEEYAIYTEIKFEKTFGGGAETAPSGQTMYIYKQLMKPWYYILAGRTRYNNEKLKMIRKDWINYIGLLEGGSIARFMAMETYNESLEESYEEKIKTILKKADAIEHAFAAEVNDGAEEKLSRIKETDPMKFNRNTGDLAPDGFRYGISDEPVPE